MNVYIVRLKFTQKDLYDELVKLVDVYKRTNQFIKMEVYKTEYKAVPQSKDK